MDSNQPVFTILSFVGGGIRGLLSATILQRLAEKHDHVLKNTLMLAGCSTGAIITSELLAGKTPADLIELFTSPTGEIKFYNNMNDRPDRPAYPIADVIASQAALHGDAPVSKAPRSVLLVSFNVGGLETRDDGRVVPKPWDTLMFTNMLGTEQDRIDGLEGNADTPIAIAASSSGAMPGQLGSVLGNVDGAFFNHDPTVAAICLAVRNGVPLEKIVAITIGTGLMPDWVASDTAEWGAKQWMDGDGNPFDNIPPFLMNQARSSPVLDMCLSGTSAETMPRLAKMLLGDRYVNINPRLPCFIPENSTNAQAIELLQRHGNEVNIDEAVALIGKYWHQITGPLVPIVPPPLVPPLGPNSAVAAAIAKVRAAAASAANEPPPPTAGHGEFFYIQHKETRKVLDIRGQSAAPGTPVILWDKKPVDDKTRANQQWEFVPAAGEPGWWYLQTAMPSDMVLTLGDSVGAAPQLDMQAKSEASRARQLWSLISTEDIGWWFIQCKAQVVLSEYSNPDSVVPAVIAAADEGQPYKVAVGLPLDYAKDGPMSWGFLRLDDALSAASRERRA